MLIEKSLRHLFDTDDGGAGTPVDPKPLTNDDALDGIPDDSVISYKAKDLKKLRSESAAQRIKTKDAEEKASNLSKELEEAKALIAQKEKDLNLTAEEKEKMKQDNEKLQGLELKVKEAQDAARKTLLDQLDPDSPDYKFAEKEQDFNRLTEFVEIAKTKYVKTEGSKPGFQGKSEPKPMTRLEYIRSTMKKDN
jgi:hypothetical protein